ncbi:hypothetical protein, partial [Acidithiobacillus thiooxidans]|uniref:hypothetical protein n=1 Tax=Acidithiobacillus thiooxidans TaxID=930 RepID=UPI001F32A032
MQRFPGKVRSSFFTKSHSIRIYASSLRGCLFSLSSSVGIVSARSSAKAEVGNYFEASVVLHS